MIGFCSMGADANLDEGCGILEHVFQGSKMFPVLFQDFMDGHVKP